MYLKCKQDFYTIIVSENVTGSARKKGRSNNCTVRDKSLLTLYTKLHSLVGLLAELLNIQVLTDTAVLHASSMAVSPFFVEEVSELQLSALKLVTTVSRSIFFYLLVVPLSVLCNLQKSSY